jgi:7,8-dihydropterin-6-yl-methyl-4-(beta-D-ribofuranosyl)aminobenzene 5'-phosphate synthase
MLELWDYSRNVSSMKSSVSRLLEEVRIDLLVENTARGAGILGEHGLAWCLRSGGSQVLFDLGQGMALSHNAKRMGVQLEATDSVVFSHGHYDHIGGWGAVSSAIRTAGVSLHPAALETKFQKGSNGKLRSAGDSTFGPAMRQLGDRLRLSRIPIEIIPGVWATGEVPRKHSVEDTGGDFYCGSKGTRVDAILDDQSLFFRTDRGLVLLLGCAHAGLINTLDYVMELSGSGVHAILGGMHLLHADATRMDFTIHALRAIDPDWLAPNHCTGDAAVALLRAAFPQKVFEMHAGQSCIFPRTEKTMEVNGGKTL